MKFYFKKLIADIKTWSKNTIKLDSTFVLGASFFPTKCSLFYWLCISRYIYSMALRYRQRLFILPTYDSEHCWAMLSTLLGSGYFFHLKTGNKSKKTKYRISANRRPLLIRTPGDTFWVHYGQFWRKIVRKYCNFRRFFAEIDHGARPKNPKNQ